MSSVKLEIFVSEYFRYFLEVTCLKFNFVCLVAGPVGTVCIVAYWITSQQLCKSCLAN